jgi:hypothetical protein
MTFDSVGVHTRAATPRTYLSQLADLLPEPADAGERRVSRVFEAHLVHHRVNLPRKDAHNGEGGHVEADANACLQLRSWQRRAVRDNVAGSGGRLHNNFS